MNNFAKRLNQALSERQLSQCELATAIGKGKSSVSQYLSGRSVPRPDVQEKIAEVLECTVEWLNSEVASNDTSDNGLRNVSVSDAAKIIGKGEEFVRSGLRMGTAPFGFAVRNKTRWSYHISPKKLNEYVGV